MGVRNKKQEELRRLDSKTLDARFLNEIQNGLNCSPFEAEAVLEVVKEVYFPFLDEQSVKAPPGKVTLIAVSADEPAGIGYLQVHQFTDPKASAVGSHQQHPVF